MYKWHCNCWPDRHRSGCIITPESWHPNWTLQEADVQLPGIGTISQVKQSTRWVDCIGTEGQRGELRPYVADTAINLWGRDLLQKWNTQINIPAVSETHNSGKDVIRYYEQRSPAIQAIQEHRANNKPLEVPTALPLKWLTEKTIWVKKWPLAEDKLQALERLVQEQLDARHIEE